MPRIFGRGDDETHDKGERVERIARDVSLLIEAERGRVLTEESREMVVVLDTEQRIVAASRRARQSIEGLDEGEPAPRQLLAGELGVTPYAVPYDLAGRRETLVYLSQAGDMTAYEELRTGFTAAVSHELRTPLARLLALLETATLPGEDVRRARRTGPRRGRVGARADRRGAVPSELESGGRVVSLGSVPVRPELDIAAAELEDRASRAGVSVTVEGDDDIELEMRPRMLRVIAQNLTENAIRYAGPGARFTLAVGARTARSCSAARTTAWAWTRTSCRGCSSASTARIRARASRGTGLGLAIVKHIVGSGGRHRRGVGRSRARASRSAASSRAVPERRLRESRDDRGSARGLLDARHSRR